MKKYYYGLTLLLFLSLLLSLTLFPTPFWVLPPDLCDSILWSIRFPRILTAIIVGASLAMAGATFQGILQNPLADPYVLGVSSGAALGACLCLLLGGLALGPLAVPISTCLGAILTIYLVYKLAQKRQSLTHLILAGIIFNALFSALNLLILFLAENKLRGMMMWLMGDLSTNSYTTLALTLPIVAIISIRLIQLAPKMNFIALGDHFAQSTGIPVQRIRNELFILSSLLCGLAVANAGVIGFIGLMVPHGLRLIIKDNFKHIVPLSALTGAAFLVIADILSRLLVPTTELPVGVITALIGAPFFLWLFLRKTPHA